MTPAACLPRRTRRRQEWRPAFSEPAIRTPAERWFTGCRVNIINESANGCPWAACGAVAPCVAIRTTVRQLHVFLAHPSHRRRAEPRRHGEGRSADFASGALPRGRTPQTLFCWSAREWGQPSSFRNSTASLLLLQPRRWGNPAQAAPGPDSPNLSAPASVSPCLRGSEDAEWPRQATVGGNPAAGVSSSRPVAAFVPDAPGTPSSCGMAVKRVGSYGAPSR